MAIYDYSFLRKPLMGPDDPNCYIATCNLDGISRYLCPTTGGDPWKCLDCRGIRSCTAGQRAMVLLDEETRAQAMEQELALNEADEEEIKKAERKETLKKARKEEALKRQRERCEAALLSGDPKKYITDRLGLSENSVKTTLKRWRQAFPDAFEEFTLRKNQERRAEKVVMEEPMDDLVSLEAFLSQYAPKTVAEKSEEPVSKAGREPAKENVKIPARDLAELMRQEAQLLEKVAELQEQIWAIRKERKRLEAKMSH